MWPYDNLATLLVTLPAEPRASRPCTVRNYHDESGVTPDVVKLKNHLDYNSLERSTIHGSQTEKLQTGRGTAETVDS